MKTIIKTDYDPRVGPQLELVTNNTLVWQLTQLANTLPMVHAAHVAVMQIAARRIQAMTADYSRKGPVTDEEFEQIMKRCAT